MTYQRQDGLFDYEMNGGNRLCFDGRDYCRTISNNNYLRKATHHGVEKTIIFKVTGQHNTRIGNRMRSV